MGYTQDPPRKIIRKFLKNKGDKCPFCESENIQSADAFDDDFECTMVCNDCDMYWLEIYTLSGLLIDEDGLKLLQEKENASRSDQPAGGDELPGAPQAP